jgi:hypothetical protein
MASIRIHTRIDAPADDVWKVVADTGNIADWFGPISESSQTGDVRTVTLAGGPTLEERIVTNDAELRRLQYQITSGLPLESHLGTIDVIDDGGSTLLVYSTDVKPDALADTFKGALRAGVDGLKAYVEGRS